MTIQLLEKIARIDSRQKIRIERDKVQALFADGRISELSYQEIRFILREQEKLLSR